mgnify:CR=1 FL=1
MYQNLAVFAAFLLTYSIFAGRFESRLLNGPLMFMLAGLLLGPAALGLLQADISKEEIKFLAELTLAIVLFSDAANANLKVLHAYEWLPLRLLLIGLPLGLSHLLLQPLLGLELEALEIRRSQGRLQQQLPYHRRRLSRNHSQISARYRPPMAMA